MHRKLTLAILAAVSLSAIALAPTAASARHFGGGGYDNGCFRTRPVLTRFGYRVRTVNICGY